ncbi:hypothetical protein [Candidatus Chloroploca sp. Khr17]|nr:hypothetical protein [Candidatus Chloroploca sp. Khr17]
MRPTKIRSAKVARSCDRSLINATIAVLEQEAVLRVSGAAFGCKKDWLF